MFADEHERSTDDLLGYTVLYSDIDTDHIPISPYYLQDLHLCADIIKLSPRTELDNTPQDPDVSTYAAQVGSLLQSLRPSYVSLLDASLYLDYGPWARYMIAAEDEQAAVLARAEDSMGTRRRVTRNSQKAEKSSWLSLEAEQRQVLSGSGLSV